MRIAYCVMRSWLSEAHCVLRIAYCVLRIAYCVLRIGVLRIAYCASTYFPHPLVTLRVSVTLRVLRLRLGVRWEGSVNEEAQRNLGYRIHWLELR